MQELTFEQADVVSGGTFWDIQEVQKELEYREQVMEQGGGSGRAAEIAKKGYDAFFMVAGAVIGGAISAGLGAAAGSALGGVVSAAAWQASKDEMTHFLCKPN